ncbi:hypothetical protein [Streptomyces cinereoruber]|uniref:hypothetical protein n=1 Tax=Streptomyces cinereoruber TaxID=67260 RepID=UPI0036518950
MSEEHSGLSHDLPEYTPNTDPLPTRWRVQLYRSAWGWQWGHQCDAITHRQGHGYKSWLMALRYANEHAKECL